MGQRNKPCRRCWAPERYFAARVQVGTGTLPARPATPTTADGACPPGEHVRPKLLADIGGGMIPAMGRDRGEQVTPDLFSTETVRDGSPSPIKPFPAAQIAVERPHTDMCCRRTSVQLSST